MKRMTKQRKAILDSFITSNHPLSIEEILAIASKLIPDLNMSTVYRNIRLLVDEGKINAIDLPASSRRYERSDLSHHHHFLCQKCCRLFDISGCPTEIQALVPTGFKMVSHSITLNGYCASCLE